MKVKSESEVAQSFPTLSDPMDCSLPGSSIHAVFQESVLEWGAIAFSGVNDEDNTKWDGVLRLTILSEHEKPLAERLIFRKPSSPLTIKFKIDEGTFF